MAKALPFRLSAIFHAIALTVTLYYLASYVKVYQPQSMTERPLLSNLTDFRP
ncbi:MAG: hypothetical protein AAF215_15120 [Cyanobacteria bacterium P01_A01_bin.123]